MALIPATLAHSTDGIPYSAAFDDIYHSNDGGIGQIHHVFMGGNALPGRWQGRPNFVVLETGFGLGLSFLATWQAWRDDPQRSERLHFISVEKHPFSRDDLATLHRQWPDLAPLAAQLLAQWPVLVPGFHRLHLDDGRVTLTLLLGDALDLLPKLVAEVDAFYLDGFAPSKNPELWSPPLFKQIARLAAPSATAATYTVAALVRDGLQAAGFKREKRPGFGKKRDMLAARFMNPRPSHLRPPADRHAIVLGAGLAGTATAARLAARGFRVELIERRGGPAQECSGNPVGVLLPVMSLDDNRQSRLSRAALLYGLRHLAAISPTAPTTGWWKTSGVLHLASDADDAAHQQRVIDTLGLPPEFARFVAADAASSLAGRPVKHGGWWFGHGASANPASICTANLAAFTAAIRPHYNVEIASIVRDGEHWQVFDGTGRLVAAAPILVIASAAGGAGFAQTAHLPLTQAWRQLSCIPAHATPPLDIVVCGDGYVTPTWNGVRAVGASEAGGPGLAQAAGHRSNLALAEGLLPGFTAGIDAAQLPGRISYRPASPDRMPLIGPIADAAAFDPQKHHRPLLVPRHAGLYCALGFGARGLTWSALAGELLASQIAGEPWPVERDLADAVDPARFLLRLGKAQRSDDTVE